MMIRDWCANDVRQRNGHKAKRPQIDWSGKGDQTKAKRC